MHRKRDNIGLSLIVGSLGIVYGDIGTSPLYSMTEAFFGHYPLKHTPENILGVVSLVFWSLMIIVTIKYVIVILRADNNGEGGIFALMGLLMKQERLENQPAPSAIYPRIRFLLFGAVTVGAALLYGDGIITPAISVLSAVEGLSIVTPAAKNFEIPATVVILIALFLLQKKKGYPSDRLAVRPHYDPLVSDDCRPWIGANHPVACHP